MINFYNCSCTNMFCSQFAKSKRRPSDVNNAPITVQVQPLYVNTLANNLPTRPIPTESEISKEHEKFRRDLTIRDKEIITNCWRKYIQNGKRDVFHKTMLFCIEASPKLNEIIACQKYCYRDLTKWPKLDRICKAQFNFFEKLIFELKLDDQKMREACFSLGETHRQYVRYGLKPHFLDIFHQQYLGLISNLPFEDREERTKTVNAFNRLMSQIIDVMYQSWSLKNSERHNH